MVKEIVNVYEGGVHAGDDRAFARLGYRAGVTLDTCHGISIAANAGVQASAGISGAIANHLSAQAEVQVGVDADLALIARLSPDVLDTAGLEVVARASLKAYARVALGVNLSPLGLLQLAKDDQSNRLQDELLELFLSKTEISAGVQGTVQVAISAGAEVACLVRLRDKKNMAAGVDVRLAIEGAFLFGAGLDFTLMLRFPDLNDYTSAAIDTIARESALLVGNIDGDDDPWGFALKAWTCAAKLTALGQGSLRISDHRAAIHTILVPILTDAIHDAFLKSYQTALNTSLIDIDQWLSGPSDPDARSAIALALLDLGSNDLNTADLADLLGALNHLLTLLTASGYPKATELARALTVLQTVAFLIDDDPRATWATLPSYASAQYKETTGVGTRKLRTATAAAYLNELFTTNFVTPHSGLGADLITVITSTGGPGIGWLLDTLQRPTPTRQAMLNATALELLTAIFQSRVAPVMTRVIAPHLQSAGLDPAFYGPLIDGLSHSFPTIFAPLLIKQNNGDLTKLEVEQLAFLSNRLILSLVADNAGRVGAAVLDHVSGQVTHNVNQLRGWAAEALTVRTFDEVKDEALGSLALPVDLILTPTIKRLILAATTTFVNDILDPAETAFGKRTWTPDRIQRISNLMRAAVLDPDAAALDFTTITAADLATQITAVQKCSFLPTVHTDALNDLSELALTIGYAQLKAFLYQVPLAIELYFRKLGLILVASPLIILYDYLDYLAQQAYAALEEAVRDFAKAVAEVAKELAALAIEIGELAAELWEASKTVIVRFFNSLLSDLFFENLNWLQKEWQDLWGDSDEEKKRKIRGSVIDIRDAANERLGRKDEFVTRVQGLATGPGLTGHNLPRVVSDADLDKLRRLKYKSGDAVDHFAVQPFQDVNTTNLKILQAGTDYTNFQGQLTKFENQERHKAAEAADALRAYRAAQQDAKDLQNTTITITSPLPVDAANRQLPMYGRHVYLEVDFGGFDVYSTISRQPDWRLTDLLVRGSNGTYGFRDQKQIEQWMTKREQDPLSTGHVMIKIILNGTELDPNSFFHAERTLKTKLSTHVDRKFLIHGTNHLYVFALTPTDDNEEPIVRHVSFTCDTSGKQHPTNSVYINPDLTVIDTKGDDHLDARRTGTAAPSDDKEVVAITNANDTEIDLTGWELNDAHGFFYRFTAREHIKPQDTRMVIVGESPEGKGWIGKYSGNTIALLNNKGEFLTLSAPDGRVVSHLYHGSPRSNPDIRFAKEI